MPIQLIRLMDSYAKRVNEKESHRLQDVRHSALRLAAEIDKVLKERGDQVPPLKKAKKAATGK
jgi:hypothetical protein